jgi:hypothetical protein
MADVVDVGTASPSSWELLEDEDSEMERANI